MPFEVALASLREGLYADVYIQVVCRSDHTFDLAEPNLASIWEPLVRNWFDDDSIWFAEVLAESEHVSTPGHAT